ncbi:MAG: M28 family peptidase [Candidatus Hodarchaeota archaeon]
MQTDERLAQRLKTHVEEMGLFRCPIQKYPPSIPPYTHYGYEHAQEYIERQLSANRIPFHRQPVMAEGQTFYNIITKINGDQPILVLTAHYDTAYLCAGADDNGSSVAVLLELIRVLKPAELPVQFVFFTLEEGDLEYLRLQEKAWIQLVLEMRKEEGKRKGDRKTVELAFDKDDIWKHAFVGSRAFVKANRKTLKQAKGVINLESVGYYSSEEGSQEDTSDGLFPTTGDFLAIICNNQSLKIAERCCNEGQKYAFPFHKIQEEEKPKENLLWRTDHIPFWKADIPAITLTDTLERRYKYYHMPLDLPKELDYEKMAKLVKILASVIKISLQEEEGKAKSPEK